MPDSTSRRNFMKHMAYASAALPAVAALAQNNANNANNAKPATKPAEQRDTIGKDLRVAFIGTGGMGGGQMNEFWKLGVQCPCYCDVDASHWSEAHKKYPDAKGYQDYREMLDKEKNNIDAVTVGVPDHHHYPATILAMRLGKHVYTQKPLTHTVWEARQLTEAAKSGNLATQMGNQGHAGEGWRKVYEWIHSGVVGHIKEVHCWTNRPIWPQGLKRPKGEDPVPASLNWDVWLGAAPVRPFKKDTYHPFKWRGWWDFGCGALGDMACHTMDGIFIALDPGYPTSVEPIACGEVDEQYPNSSLLKWEFPAKGERPAFNVFWYEGGLKPARPPELEMNKKLPETGNLFIGDKATILVEGDYGDKPRIIPETKAKEVGPPPHMLDRSPGHYREWVLAATGQKPITFAKSNFLYAGPFTETILLGAVSQKMGRRLEWDGPRLQVTNVPEANKYINKEYREGWKF